MKAKELIALWKGRVLAASLPFEADWTWRALRNADPDLAQRLREQIDYFDEMCVLGTPRDIAEHGAATVRGYAAAVELMQRVKAKEERVSLAKQGPNLQELVAKHGGYDKITEPAWEQFEREKIVWRAKLRFGEFDTEVETITTGGGNTMTNGNGQHTAGAAADQGGGRGAGAADPAGDGGGARRAAPAARSGARRYHGVQGRAGGAGGAAHPGRQPGRDGDRADGRGGAALRRGRDGAGVDHGAGESLQHPAPASHHGGRRP